GRVAEEIRRESRRRGAGLVVIGAQGEHATGATDGMGATARQVLEHAVGMVLVVPEIARAGPPRLRRILVPLDGSSWSETALPVALRVARATGAGVTLVQVVAAPDPAGALPPEREDVDLRERLLDRDERVAKRHLEQLRRAFVDQGVSGRAQVVRGDDARAALSALLAREPVDLVVMSACGHGGARSSSARCGGVPAHLAGRAPTPLLIVRPASARVSRGHEMAAPRAAFAPPVDAGLGAGAGW
ncbi:MAG: universal stress protein, partial [Rhodobacteraceae bacterium]